jgi:hypothetical protein
VLAVNRVHPIVSQLREMVVVEEEEEQFRVVEEDKWRAMMRRLAHRILQLHRLNSSNNNQRHL